MKRQDWIFSVRYFAPGSDLELRNRWAVVGPARASTVEAALHLANVPEDVRAQVRGCDVVRDFVEGRCDPDRSGYYAYSRVEDDGAGSGSWAVCIGSVHEVLDR